MYTNLDRQILLSAQSALLGQVPPALRAVSVDIDEQSIYFRCIFDSTATEHDRELLSVTVTEIIADFAAPYTIEEEYLSVEVSNGMNHLKHLVYLRHENRNS